jgi:hypothetical protein
MAARQTLRAKSSAGYHLATPNGSAPDGSVEDAQSSGHRATGTARIAGVDAGCAADFALTHDLRVDIAAPVDGFYSALRATLTAATAIPFRTAEAALFRGRVRRTGIRVTDPRRTVRRLALDATISAIAVEALAARLSVPPQLPSPRALVPGLFLAVFVIAVCPALPVSPAACIAGSSAQLVERSAAPGDCLASQFILSVVGERVRGSSNHRPAKNQAKRGPQRAPARPRGAESSGQAIECDSVQREGPSSHVCGALLQDSRGSMPLREVMLLQGHVLRAGRHTEKGAAGWPPLLDCFGS